MSAEQPRLLVIGAGVNGSICATRLYRARCNVTVLARGRRYEAIRDQGIIIEDPMTTRCSVTRVPVIDTLNPQDRYDYILVVVRANQIPALLPDLARNVSPNVVFMGNNLSSTAAYTAALGKDRVLLGFVFGAGKRDGAIVRAWAPSGPMARALVAPFGEVDGTITPRLKKLVTLFRQAGLQAKASRVIVEYLTTHAAQVAVVASLIVKHGCDTAALARSTADLRLLVEGLRESLEVLRATGHRIVPWSTAAMRYVPRVVLVGIYRLLFASKMGEVGAAWHCAQAPDEMAYLAAGLTALVERSGCAAPELRRILAMNQQERPRELPSGMLSHSSITME